MDRRQILTGFLATLGSSGAASLIASLEPALVKSQPLLRAVGEIALFGAAIGFMVLLMTAPTHRQDGGVIYERQPFLTEQMRGLIVMTLCIGIPFFLFFGMLIWSVHHPAPQ
jgi:hypothetical protein